MSSLKLKHRSRNNKSDDDAGSAGSVQVPVSSIDNEKDKDDNVLQVDDYEDHHDHHGDDDADDDECSNILIANKDKDDTDSLSMIRGCIKLKHCIRRLFVDLRRRYRSYCLGALSLVGFMLILPLLSSGGPPYLYRYRCLDFSTSEGVAKFLADIDATPQNKRCVARSSLQKTITTKGCYCPNPVQRVTRLAGTKLTQEPWQNAFQANLKLAHAARRKSLDVVLLGDSITEAWHGTNKARPAEQFAGNAQVYKKLFDSDDSPVQGLALGIAGDRCNQLLYRLQHGEIDGLDPNVFWILIGTNDFLKFSCRADHVVAGNIRIVQEILSQKPRATVVIQSLLPVGDAKNGIQNWDIYQEINRQLECYASASSSSSSSRNNKQVMFVDMTSLFLMSSDRRKVNETMLPDRLHPQGAAAEVWGKQIVIKVLEIIDASKSKASE